MNGALHSNLHVAGARNYFGESAASYSLLDHHELQSFWHMCIVDFLNESAKISINWFQMTQTSFWRWSPLARKQSPKWKSLWSSGQKKHISSGAQARAWLWCSLIFAGLCAVNLFPKSRLLTFSNTVTFCGIWGRTFCTNDLSCDTMAIHPSLSHAPLSYCC